MKAIGIIAVMGVLGFGAYHRVQSDEVLGDLQALRVKACACETAECGELVLSEVAELLEANTNVYGNEAQLKSAYMATEMTMECVVKTNPSDDQMQQFLARMSKISE